MAWHWVVAATWNVLHVHQLYDCCYCGLVFMRAGARLGLSRACNASLGMWAHAWGERRGSA